jgi:hypothetical protein
MGFTETPSSKSKGLPGSNSRKAMLFRRTSWLQGPLVRKYAAMRGETQTGRSLVLTLSKPK